VSCTSTGVAVAVSEPATGFSVLRTVAAVDAAATDCAVVTQVADATAGRYRDVPKIKKNTDSKLLLLTKEEVDLVNAFFQSVHLVFHGTAPVWF
jgi:hypothetical protein